MRHIGNQSYVIIIVLLGLCISACITKHSNFSYFREKPFVENSRHIPLNGIYSLYGWKENSRYPADCMFFYMDGTCKVSIFVSTVGTNFWSSPETKIEYLKNEWSRYPVSKTEWWGHYKIRNDSIFIQTFELFDQSTVLRRMVSLRGIIKNDSTINISELQCTFCDSSSKRLPVDNRGILLFNESAQYNFYPSSFKPDSSLAWFKKKKWYKKEREKLR